MGSKEKITDDVIEKIKAMLATGKSKNSIAVYVNLKVVHNFN